MPNIFHDPAKNAVARLTWAMAQELHSPTWTARSRRRSELRPETGLVDMRRYWLLAPGTTAIALLLAFPPYMVIDQSEPATRHAAIGHHPRWQPPTPDRAEETLTIEVGPPRAGVQPSLRIGVNRVRLAAEVVTVTAAALCALGARRWRRRRNA